MKRRQLLFWISCPRATPPTLLISIFVSPWYPKWEHVLWAQEAFLCILEVSFSSLSSQNLTKPLVFGALSEYNKEANWIYLFLQFSGEDITLCPQPLKEWRTGLRTILGEFLSVFFYLAKLSSVWCAKCNMRVWGTKCFLLLLLSSVGRDHEYREHGFQWNI